MSYLSAWQSLTDHWRANWSHTPTAYGNEYYTPTQTDAWVRLTVRDGGADNVGFGSGIMTRRGGVIFLQVFTPLLQGETQARWLADKARAVFENQRIGDVLIRAANLSWPGLDDSWYQLVLSLDFQRHEVT